MLVAIRDKCEELGLSVDPNTVICDFEQAAINSLTATLGRHVAVKGCFYHIMQSSWQKIQELGLTNAYRNNEELKHFCGMLDALAFLPLAEVGDGMTFLRGRMPGGRAWRQ